MNGNLDFQKQVVEDILREARRQGATDAEAGVSNDGGLSVTVRMGKIETVEQSQDQSMGITVYLGKRKGSSSTTDFSPSAIRESVKKACTIAKYTSEDPAAGLPDAMDQAIDYPELDLYHPWEINVEQAASIAAASEQAARESDHRITNSEGATLSSQQGSFIYGNSNSFLGGYPITRHDISCVVMAEEGTSMQRDYWYDTSRLPQLLDSPEHIGQLAAQRAVRQSGCAAGWMRYQP